MTEPTACHICYDDTSSEILKLQNCEHTFCKSCLAETYRCLIEDQNMIEKLTCPQHGCENVLTENELSQFISNKLVRKYKKFRLNKEVAKDPGLMFCPNVNCETVITIEYEQQSTPEIVCNTCKLKICCKCKKAEHPGKSCETAIDQSLKDWIKSTSGVHLQNCPNCSALCEKNGGCPLMRCGVCDYEWCWTCGMKSQNWFHRIQGHTGETGKLCETANKLFYESEQVKDLPEIIKILLAILMITMSPLMALLIGTLIGPIYVIKERCTIWPPRSFNIKYESIWHLFLMPVYSIIYMFLVVPFTSVSIVAVIYLLILVLFLVLRILFINCLTCRKVDRSNARLQENYEKSTQQKLESLRHHRAAKKEIERQKMDSQPKLKEDQNGPDVNHHLDIDYATSRNYNTVQVNKEISITIEQTPSRAAESANRAIETDHIVLNIEPTRLVRKKKERRHSQFFSLKSEIYQMSTADHV